MLFAQVNTWRALWFQLKLHLLFSCFWFCRGWEVSLVLYPSTAQDSVSQFVRLTLRLTLDQQVCPPPTPPPSFSQSISSSSLAKLELLQRGMGKSFSLYMCKPGRDITQKARGSFSFHLTVMFYFVLVYHPKYPQIHLRLWL
ncbi:hypothetical protein ILYODFUR_011508 [Ilyodon furcidens]|uniref:Secreted protein n=1 Tax=Ilyodon furcidens TaxID=33524 RepID=A0ABV0SMW1_9TELE